MSCLGAGGSENTVGAKGLTILDTLITLCIIGVLTGVVIVKYRQVSYAAQEAAVKTALVNIRTSITLFKMLNGRNPHSLREMIGQKVMIPARVGADKYTGPIFLKKEYLMEYAVDKDGNVIDAFENPFIYDPVQGEVKATTKGYETW
jgi:type II secretory pathway pseudopilin PulG